MASLNKQISSQIKKMPKYTINPEVFQSQSLARSRAFGRDRSAQMAEEDMEEQMAGDIATAKDVTDSTSGLLSTLTSLNANMGSGKRSLAGMEADIQRQNVGDLYGANQMVIDEKDKAWNQNVYAPWEAKLRGLQEKKARRSAFWNNVTGGLLSAAGAFFGAGGADLFKKGGRTTATAGGGDIR